jgi:hypothetical protein
MVCFITKEEAKIPKYSISKPDCTPHIGRHAFLSLLLLEGSSGGYLWANDCCDRVEDVTSRAYVGVNYPMFSTAAHLDISASCVNFVKT